MRRVAHCLALAFLTLGGVATAASAGETRALYRLVARGAADILGGTRDFHYTIEAEKAGSDFRLIYRDVDPRGNGIRSGDLFFVGTLTDDVAEGRVYYRIPHHPPMLGLFAGGRCPDLTAPATVRVENGGRRLDIVFTATERDGFTCRPTGKMLNNQGTLDLVSPPAPVPPKVAEAPTPPPSPPSPELPPVTPPAPSSGSSAMALWIILAFGIGVASATVWFALSTRPPPLPDPPLHPRPSGTPRSPRLSDFLPQYPGSPWDAIRSPTENLRARRNFTEESTGLLRAKADETKALGEVMHARSQVALQLGEYAAIAPLLKHGDPNADASSVTLTLPEIAETLRIGLPALSNELRAEVIALIRQAMEAKLT